MILYAVQGFVLETVSALVHFVTVIFSDELVHLNKLGEVTVCPTAVFKTG